jgi:molecular chaperone IbpA
MAIAGFKQEDIDITREKGVLTVKANSKGEKSSDVNYLYKGIGTRSFTKTFKLADTVVIRNATFENGILQISLENVIPEEQKPLKIQIGKPTNLSATKKFLAD